MSNITIKEFVKDLGDFDCIKLIDVCGREQYFTDKNFLVDQYGDEIISRWKPISARVDNEGIIHTCLLIIYLKGGIKV